MWKILRDKRGLSLIEMVVTMVILTLLASLIVPSAQMAAKRTKELELRRNLREIRTAIDEYKKNYDKALSDQKTVQVLNATGYPKKLGVLVEGDDFGGLVKEKKKFLRRIPKDPFFKGEGDDNTGWGLRSHADEFDSTKWGGEDVFDVHSLSDGVAIDGTKYKDW
ncbi:type II secretion system GspH family protein [Geomonas sp. Red69]|uniref:Type II secretion system GspH family protein n=1 Tax=Geomonas diazotrophica TaxID=2843197 RepID=A0ABX8JLD7_9BACT|nr:MULTISPECIES: type II secretion system protein [Geomonas]MBU5637735.1 type II secretion system GspH family protein [Geomonas diazotrophica]QWV96270.1 type II secretion system GspH family protein [Geomonas nitrogeniifigens]QXE85337.1 type II secretion system GspH family protein [Geomonas nitrogeniifigens]